MDTRQKRLEQFSLATLNAAVTDPIVLLGLLVLQNQEQSRDTHAEPSRGLGGSQGGGCAPGSKGNTAALISWNAACRNAGSAGTGPNSPLPPTALSGVSPPVPAL